MGKSIMQRRFPLNKYRPLMVTVEVLVLILLIFFNAVYVYGFGRALAEAEYYMQSNTSEFIADKSLRQVSECVFEEGTNNCMLTFEGEETPIPANDVSTVYAKLKDDTVYYSTDNNTIIKSSRWAGFFEFISASRLLFVILFNIVIMVVMLLLRKGDRPIWSKPYARWLTVSISILSILLLGVSVLMFSSGY